MVWLPLLSVVVSSDFDHDVVPLVAEYPPPSRAMSTRVTLTLSPAAPLIVIVPLTVAPVAGDAIVIDGAVPSGAMFEKVTDSLVTFVLPEVSLARADNV